MRIGLDFDNTIVSYDALFHTVALEKKLISKELPISKLAVRDYLRNANKEDLWTEMQGYVYGARMREARAYGGVFDALSKLLVNGHELFIVSHKTKHPFIGEQYDLHQAAQEWILNNLQQAENNLISSKNVYFELSKEAKLNRISQISCDIFIDDLPEILLAPTFPLTTKRILFDPEKFHDDLALGEIQKISHWEHLPRLIKDMK